MLHSHYRLSQNVSTAIKVVLSHFGLTFAFAAFFMDDEDLEKRADQIQGLSG